VAPRGPVASSVWSSGTVSTGAVVSTTVTENDPVAVLLCLSLALQSTCAEPKPNGDPLPGLHDTGTLPSTRSTALAAQVATAPVGPVASTVTSFGSVSSGAVVSVTFTVNPACALLPAWSTAVHVTVFSPSANVEPEAGTHSTDGWESTASVAVGVS
jgi:hypothetical protein